MSRREGRIDARHGPVRRDEEREEKGGDEQEEDKGKEEVSGETDGAQQGAIEHEDGEEEDAKEGEGVQKEEQARPLTFTQKVAHALSDAKEKLIG